MKIFGVEIITFNSVIEAYNLIKNQISSGASGYITLNNVHTLTETLRSKEYKKAITNSSLVLADSQVLNIILRGKGTVDAVRVFGPTLMAEVLDRGQKDNLKHLLFGSTQETLKKLEVNILLKYPASNIIGMISPPFRPITKEENNEYLKIINNYDPDIIWVGLGAPKQELWMYENYRKLKRGVMIGVGAGFDYLAGNTRHAPKWMKSMALEWLYRLIQEPRRLWKRYLITNTIFIVCITLELFRLKKYD